MADARAQLEYDRRLAWEHIELRRAARVARVLRQIPGLRTAAARHGDIRLRGVSLRPLRPLARRVLR